VQTEAVAACPVCSDERRELVHAGLVDRLYGARGSWDLHQCGGCGAAYLDPRPTVEALAAAYEGYYTHEPATGPSPDTAARRIRKALRNGYLNARYGYLLRPATRFGRLVFPLFPGSRAAADRHVRTLRRPRERARLLDVGCGNGEFLAEMAAAGWIAEGLEVDERAVDQARARGLDVRHGPLEDGAYHPRSFDAVTLSHVVEHLHDPVATLRRCRELVRDDGVLWIATPNLAGRGHRRYGRAWRGLEPPRHLVLFTPSALVRAFDRAGFRLAAFERPASSAWVFDASERISGRKPKRMERRLAVARTDLGGALDPTTGDELVAVARRAS
jgi:2-polyprenyl-3-methyl-5-hydroxy-6-metoxy-1,4-benzoquinol methylase